MGVEDPYVVSGIIRRFFSRRRYSGIHGSKCQNAAFPSCYEHGHSYIEKDSVLYRRRAGRPAAQLKLAMPVPQPTPWIHTVWTPAISGARSFSETTIFAVNDSSLPSPCR